MRKKLETSIQELCQDVPVEIREYMEYCRRLKFDEDPDYKYCIDLFAQCMMNNKLNPMSLDFCWKKKI